MDPSVADKNRLRINYHFDLVLCVPVLFLFRIEVDYYKFIARLRAYAVDNRTSSGIEQVQMEVWKYWVEIS